MLFFDSLHYNLDPFKQYDDLKLWKVLWQVELNDVMLDHDIFSGGHNFNRSEATHMPGQSHLEKQSLARSR